MLLFDFTHNHGAAELIRGPVVACQKFVLPITRSVLTAQAFAECRGKSGQAPP